jgi:oxygen-independent coproporphyrinogen-3 oxidase
VCELGVQHLSAYHLGIEPGTVFGRRFSEGRLSEVSEAVSNEHYGLVCRRLREAGFEHYEISNFAKSGYRSLHNSSYWQGVPYLGVGPAAHSYEGRNRYWNVANISKYISTVDSLEHIEGEILSQEDIYNEYVMTRLRTSEGIDIEDFKSRFGVESSDRLLTDSQPARKIGNIIVVDRWLRIPEEKFLISDSIISELFLG